MPSLRVENAKSSRSRCALKACSAFIQKGELRIGTGVQMPGMDDLSYKWRHLCCFTERQIKNMGGSVDNVDGYDDLTAAEQELVRQMLAGKLCGDRSVIGRGADASGATVEVVGGVKKVAPSKAKGKVGAADVAARKRPRELDVVSESTDDYDTEVVEEAARPPVCPFGATCFRKNPDHFRQFSHGDAPKAAPASSEKLLAVIAKKRPATAVVEDFLLTTRPVVPVLPTGSPGATKLGARCPHGALCFRNDPKHFVDFDHS